MHYYFYTKLIANGTIIVNMLHGLKIYDTFLLVNYVLFLKVKLRECKINTKYGPPKIYLLKERHFIRQFLTNYMGGDL